MHISLLLLLAVAPAQDLRPLLPVGGRQQVPVEEARSAVDPTTNVGVAAWLERDLAVGMVVRASVGLGPDGGKSFAPSQKLNTDGSSADKRALSLVIQKGSFHVYWLDDRAGAGATTLYQASSFDGGFTWLETALPDGSGVPSGRDLLAYQAMACGGRIFLLQRTRWTGGGDALHLLVSQDAGLTWQPPLLVPSGFSPGSVDVDGFAMAGSGSAIHLLWVDARLGHDDVWMRQSTDGGVSFASPEIRIDDPLLGGDSGDGLVLVAETAGPLHALWLETPAGSTGEQLHYRSSADGGLTWAPGLVLNSGANLGSDVDGPVLWAEAGQVVAAWEDNRSGSDRVWLRNSTDGGMTWTQAISLDSGKGGRPSLTGSGSLVALSFLQGAWPEEAALAFSLDGGGSWLPTVDASAAAGLAGDADQATVTVDSRYRNVLLSVLDDSSGDNEFLVGGWRPGQLVLEGTPTAGGVIRFRLDHVPADLEGEAFRVFGSGSPGLWALPLGGLAELSPTHRWFLSNFRRLWGMITQSTGTTNDYLFGPNAPAGSPLWFVAISQSQGLISDPVLTAIQ